MSDALSLFEAVVPPYVRPTMAEIQARPTNGLRAVSTFSGCGGSSLGLRMAGWDVRASVEFIPSAAETYRANFPRTAVLEKDIRRVTPDDLLVAAEVERGELDLLEGSPPCASFSQAGMRERGWDTVKKYSETQQRTDDLFWEWTRLLEGLAPRAFLAENVPGMLAGNALEEYAHKITRDLSELGYRVAAKVLNSANYGVPQERRRLIFVGLRHDLGARPSFPAPTVAEPHTIAQALAAVDPRDPDHAPYLAPSSMRGKAVGRTWEWRAGLRDNQACARCGRPLAEHSYEDVTVGSVRKTKDRAAETRVQRRPFCADGERAIEVKDYFLFTVPDLDRPCPTLTATGAQVGAASVVHPTECRKFTPAEAKAISGFPADFVLTGTREQRYERIGRTVTPPLYEAVGREIARALQEAT